MAIFGKGDSSDKSTRTDSDTTIITAGSTIKGEMSLTCNLYVDGTFEGVINSQRDINVGKNGKIKGDIISKRVVVQGFVDGNINSERIEIKAGGHISGSIASSELVIEAKGIFEGTSVLKDDNNTMATNNVAEEIV